MSGVVGGCTIGNVSIGGVVGKITSGLGITNSLGISEGSGSGVVVAVGKPEIGDLDGMGSAIIPRAATNSNCIAAQSRMATTKHNLVMALW